MINIIKLNSVKLFLNCILLESCFGLEVEVVFPNFPLSFFFFFNLLGFFFLFVCLGIIISVVFL